jgi:putative ABC transport system substrate-binding protein
LCNRGAGDPETNRKRAEEMVALAPAIIVAFGSSAVAALLQATRSVPEVFAGVVDPVSAGCVASLGAARWQRYRLFVV